MDKRKPIIITGQTGTGKTSLALKIANSNDAELISADSRQIYKELDIGTGKFDAQDELTNQEDKWYLKGVRIHLINRITLTEKYSAGEFADDAQNIISRSDKQQIVVGGTGFYIKSLIDPDETVSVPLNKRLRDQYDHKESSQELVLEMKQVLDRLDPDKLRNMNNSDRNNPRRLVRAIEVAEWKNQNSIAKRNKIDAHVIIGLTASRQLLERRITQRIQQMMEMGYEHEVKKLVEEYSWNAPGMQTIGYREWKEYFDNKISRIELAQQIISSHLHYARRQMIYLKRLPDIKWIDITDSSWQDRAIEYCKFD
jgi:tRNA dimethylallyltransferase